MPMVAQDLREQPARLCYKPDGDAGDFAPVQDGTRAVARLLTRHRAVFRERNVNTCGRLPSGFR